VVTGYLPMATHALSSGLASLKAAQTARVVWQGICCADCG